MDPWALHACMQMRTRGRMQTHRHALTDTRTRTRTHRLIEMAAPEQHPGLYHVNAILCGALIGAHQSWDNVALLQMITFFFCLCKTTKQTVMNLAVCVNQQIAVLEAPVLGLASFE
jgi:hypothetical protein